MCLSVIKLFQLCVWVLPAASVWVCVVSHRGHYPLDSSRRQLLSFGLLYHCDPQVLELEHHALQKGLPRVRPILWKLCR